MTKINLMDALRQSLKTKGIPSHRDVFVSYIEDALKALALATKTYEEGKEEAVSDGHLREANRRIKQAMRALRKKDGG